MNAAERTQLLRRTLLSVWALATVVLVFCVALLAHEMIERGIDPLPAPNGGTASSGPDNLVDRPSVRLLTLYFADADGRLLAPEAREVELGAFTQSNCEAALEALIEGPRHGLVAILPPTAQIRGVYLLDNGELVVDFSQEIRTDAGRPKSVSADALMVYGIVNTLTQPEIRGDDGAVVSKVRFLFVGEPLSGAFTGSPLADPFPEHFDLADPIGPSPAWMAVHGSELSSDG